MKGSNTPHSIARALVALIACLLITGIGFSGAVAAQAEHGSAPQLLTCPGTPAQCFADVPPDNGFFDNANRIYQQGVVSGYPCGGTGEPCDTENRPYYRPGNTVTRQQMSKFVDLARRQPGIFITATLTLSDTPPIYVNIAGTHAIWGQTTNGTGVHGQSEIWKGVAGFSTSDDGVYGHSETGRGVVGVSNSGTGVVGLSNGDGVYGESFNGNGLHGKSFGYGVYGESGGNNSLAGVYGTGGSTAIGVYGTSTGNYAGYFQGPVFISGPCTGCFGPSKVDHPLDPENQYLYHSSVQSDEMTNIYNGNAVLDAQGEAWVQMPAWFEAVNADFRYQLTTIGGYAPVYIAEKVNGNRFKIAGGTAGLEVSWQVTAVRSDQYGKANQVPVEQAKPAEEHGTYLHPELYGQPANKGTEYVEMQRSSEK